MTFAGVEAAGNTRNVITNRIRNTFQNFMPPPVKPPLEGGKGGGSHLINQQNRELCATPILFNSGHCEERSDVAISRNNTGLEIASLRSQ